MGVHGHARTLPVIDVAPLIVGERPAQQTEVARQIEAACREHGFFYVTGHGVAPGLLDRLAAASTAFFDLPLAAKMEIAMDRGGRAWRGYFPVGAELTSGQPDLRRGCISASSSAMTTLGSGPDSRCTAATSSPGRSPSCAAPC